MGLYTYISEHDRVNWRKVADVELKEIFDEALLHDETLMINANNCIEKQGLFKKSKQTIHYTIYHECFMNGYPTYQARQQISASGSKQIVVAYLYGIINGSKVKKLNPFRESQQRELLLAFSKWICNCTEYDVIPDSRMEEYLKANNCG